MKVTEKPRAVDSWALCTVDKLCNYSKCQVILKTSANWDVTSRLKRLVTLSVKFSEHCTVFPGSKQVSSINVQNPKLTNPLEVWSSPDGWTFI